MIHLINFKHEKLTTLIVVKEIHLTSILPLNNAIEENALPEIKFFDRQENKYLLQNNNFDEYTITRHIILPIFVHYTYTI